MTNPAAGNKFPAAGLHIHQSHVMHTEGMPS
jgi:hypothetical protein